MNPHQPKPRQPLHEYVDGILRGDRIVLGKAITLAESSLREDQTLASSLVDALLPHTGKAMRIGITGVPGVGKSTFIETFGEHLISRGKKVAVLTIDPSSPLTKGSILGDKTRMELLAKNPNAFIRPSATGDALGGLAHRTREGMLLCEAAGFDIIIIETVGVGQSEVAVKNLVDFFLLLMLGGAGDELQGIKKGIVEMADAIVITKADEDNIDRATAAQAAYKHALHLAPPSASGWIPDVLTCSAKDGTGIDAVADMIFRFEDQMRASGFFDYHRAEQNRSWMEEYFELLLRSDLQQQLGSERAALAKKVTSGEMSPRAAAEALLRLWYEQIKKN